MALVGQACIQANFYIAYHDRVLCFFRIQFIFLQALYTERTFSDHTRERTVTSGFNTMRVRSSFICITDSFI